MKAPPLLTLRRSITTSLAALYLLGSAIAANAQVSYTWSNLGTTNSTGTWSSGTNWVGGVAASGVGVTANLNVAYTGTPVINLTGSPTIGTLIVGNNGSGNSLRFLGGSGLSMTMQASGTASAAINKETNNLVLFERNMYFSSNTVITVNGGEVRFLASQSTDYGYLKGSGNISFEGGGGLSTFVGGKPEASNTYTGNITVKNNGTFLISGTFQASTSAPNASVTVGNTGTLGGKGTVARTTTVESGGTLSAGGTIYTNTSTLSKITGKDDAPGVMSFSAGLELKSGSKFNFELFSNSTANRGTAGGFDGVDVTGGILNIESGALFNLVLNGAGSTVDFSSSFWDSNQEWLVFQNSATPTVSSGIFTLGTVSTDSLGNSFSSTGGMFSFIQNGNNTYLVYSTVPEPSTWIMLLGSGVTGIAFRRRFSRRA